MAPFDSNAVVGPIIGGIARENLDKIPYVEDCRVVRPAQPHIDVVCDGTEGAECAINCEDARRVVGGVSGIVCARPAGTEKVRLPRTAVDRIASNRVRDEQRRMTILPATEDFEVPVRKGVVGPV